MLHDSQGLTDAFDQPGFPRAEVSGEGHNVPGCELFCDFTPERDGFHLRACFDGFHPKINIDTSLGRFFDFAPSVVLRETECREESLLIELRDPSLRSG